VSKQQIVLQAGLVIDPNLAIPYSVIAPAAEEVDD
jgi:hypothetical protein